MAPHSSTLAWRIPCTEEPGRLQSMGSLEVGQDWATSLSRFTFLHWRKKWQPTPVFLPGESQGHGAWWAAIYEVAQSRTRLKWLSSSSSSSSMGLVWLWAVYLLMGRVVFPISCLPCQERIQAKRLKVKTKVKAYWKSKNTYRKMHGWTQRERVKPLGCLNPL